jgi:MYXO-CTERM domain-containing protein
MTAKDGAFSFADVAPGAHSLTVSADGFQELAIDIEVAAGAASETEIELSPTEASDDGDQPGHGEGDDDPGASDDGPVPGDPDASESGCRAASGSGPLGGLLLALGLAAIFCRRRR